MPMPQDTATAVLMCEQGVFFSSFFFVINLINVTSLVSEREVKAVLGEK